MGRFLIPKYRDEIFLMTKSHAKTGEDAKKHLELSLKALKTEQLDLWQIHTIIEPRKMLTSELKTGYWMCSWRQKKKD